MSPMQAVATTQLNSTTFHYKIFRKYRKKIIHQVDVVRMGTLSASITINQEVLFSESGNHPIFIEENGKLVCISAASDTNELKETGVSD